MKNILNINNVDVKNIVCAKPVKQNQYVIIKLYYNHGSSKTSFFIKHSTLQITELSHDEIVFELNSNTSKPIVDLYENIDNMLMECIGNSGVLEQYNMKNVDYRTIVNESNTTKATINYLRLKLTDGKSSAIVYDKVCNTPLNNEQKKELFVKNKKVKIIVELNAIVIDTQNNLIYANVIVRQVLIKEEKLLNVALTECSFVHSDMTDSDDDTVKPNKPIQTLKSNVVQAVPYHSNSEQKHKPSLPVYSNSKNITESSDTETDDEEYVYEDEDDEEENNEKISSVKITKCIANVIRNGKKK